MKFASRQAGYAGSMVPFQLEIQISVLQDLVLFINWKKWKNLADCGYRDGGIHFDTLTGLHNISQRMRSLCRACHEAIDGRIKNFKVTETRFCHNIEQHQ
jgi:hypothetical protein